LRQLLEAVDAAETRKAPDGADEEEGEEEEEDTDEEEGADGADGDGGSVGGSPAHDALREKFACIVRHPSLNDHPTATSFSDSIVIHQRLQK